MPEQSSAGAEDPVPAWLTELRRLQRDQAATWAGHQFDEDGWHDEDECRVCAESRAVVNACRCGACCRRLLIECDLEDAEREPKIRECASPIYQDARLTASGQPELQGFLLNKDHAADGDYACVFLDDATNLCTIYPTRPLCCRLFDCDGEGREQLIELGVIERKPSA